MAGWSAITWCSLAAALVQAGKRVHRRRCSTAVRYTHMAHGYVQRTMQSVHGRVILTICSGYPVQGAELVAVRIAQVGEKNLAAFAHARRVFDAGAAVGHA